VVLVPRNQSLVIRPAGREDCGLILEFIHGLAEYEKLAHEVVATEAMLEQSLFGEKPTAEVIIAEWGSQAAGFALYFPNYSTFLARPGIYLEDLYVWPEFRGKSIGKSLLNFLARLAVDRGCGRLDWSVLDWNDSAINFYKSLGAYGLDDWVQYRLDGEALKNMAKEF
jgi:GNAT superfamily N-acetyltransferase